MVAPLLVFDFHSTHLPLRYTFLLQIYTINVLFQNHCPFVGFPNVVLSMTCLLLLLLVTWSSDVQHRAIVIIPSWLEWVTANRVYILTKLLFSILLCRGLGYSVFHKFPLVHRNVIVLTQLVNDWMWVRQLYDIHR